MRTGTIVLLVAGAFIVLYFMNKSGVVNLPQWFNLGPQPVPGQSQSPQGGNVGSPTGGASYT